MSILYLIRHGQASFGTLDYDALSDGGRHQARVLRAGIRFKFSNGRISLATFNEYGRLEQ